MKSKQTIPMLIALLAVIAVATPSMVFAESEEPMVNNGKYKITSIPQLTFSETSVSSGKSLSENLEKKVISITGAIASIDGTVLQIGLKPLQDHLVYYAKVLINDNEIAYVIVDAGDSRVLHITDSKTLEEIEALRAEMKASKVDKKLDRIDNKIEKIEKKLSESSGSKELNALRQHFVDKLHELKIATENGSSESIQDIRLHLQDLRTAIVQTRS